jgi:catechol 2,3-dioxygenase-like lactoylglutathione lyase family enzyme
VPFQRLDHAVLYVRDVARSLDSYRDVLGFRVGAEIPGRAVSLQAEGSADDHDLGLFAVGAGALVGASDHATTEAVYARGRTATGWACSRGPSVRPREPS